MRRDCLPLRKKRVSPVKPEVALWLNSRGLELIKLCGRRPRLPAEYIAEACGEVYDMRDKLEPIQYGWKIWELAESYLRMKSDPIVSKIADLEFELYWSRLPWYEKLFIWGIYAEGGL